MAIRDDQYAESPAGGRSSYRRSIINRSFLMDLRRRRIRRGRFTRTYHRFRNDDIIESDIAKSITSALWSDTTSTMTTPFTSSTQTGSTSGDYQWEVYKDDPASTSTATVQFNIAFGHSQGSGSQKNSGASSDDLTATKAVYTAYANMLLEPGDDKFTINGTDTKAMSFLSVGRERMKEQMNPNGWELHVSGTAGKKKGFLIDNSSTAAATTVNGNLVYSIVSGTLSAGPLNDTELGLFYPELGILAFDSNVLHSSFGLACATASNTDGGNNKVIYNAISGAANFQGRAEEDISSTHYFVRVKNSDFNFSNNPTFVTGSGVLYNASMVGDPKTFITTVGLYNDDNELVATAKLSKPLMKDFSREATIRVKLDY